MKALHTIALLGVAGILSACAAQDEPIIRPQPVFDKFGNGACEDEWIYIPGTVPALAECVPPDECVDPVYDANGNIIDCPPPPRRPDDDDDDDDSSTSGGIDPIRATTAPSSSAPRG